MSSKLPTEIETECLEASVEMTIRETLADKSQDYNELVKIYQLK